MLKDKASFSGYRWKYCSKTLISKWLWNVPSHKRHPQSRNQLSILMLMAAPYKESWGGEPTGHMCWTSRGPRHLVTLTFASFTQMKSLYESKQPKHASCRDAPEGAYCCLSLLGTPKGSTCLTEKMHRADGWAQGARADGGLWSWRWPEGGSTAQLNHRGLCTRRMEPLMLLSS